MLSTELSRPAKSKTRPVMPIKPSALPIRLDALREQIAGRRQEEAEITAEQLAACVQRFRGGDSLNPAIISVSLDRLASEVKSSLEVAASPEEPDPVARVRVTAPLRELERMFNEQLPQLRAGRLAPASFMPAAEFLARSSVRELADVRRAMETGAEAPGATLGASARRQRAG